MNINLKQSNIKFNKGTVIIASAGPGSVDLITLNLINILKLADVVIYDALVNEEILSFCKKNVKLIYAGKIKEKRACTQTEINDWLVKYSHKKNRVLRLKSGDVSFFSRASQEINFLKKNNIKINIFSGITSSQAAIHNSKKIFFNKSEICNFITGHKMIKNKKKFDYELITKNGGKIFIYMGVSQIEEITNNLLDKGIDKNEKVTIVYNASRKSQKIFHTNLNKCCGLIKKKKIVSPAIIIIK